MVVVFLFCFSVPMLAEEKRHTGLKMRLEETAAEGGPGYQEWSAATKIGENWVINTLFFRMQNHYHGPESVGYSGVSYPVFRRNGLELFAGAGIYGGRRQPFGPAGMIQANLETEKWEGHFTAIQNYRGSIRTGHGGHDEQATNTPGTRDRYLVWHISKTVPWLGERPGLIGIAQDDIGHDGTEENVWGMRFSVPVPGKPQLSVVAKIMTRGTWLVGMEFRPGVH